MPVEEESGETRMPHFSKKVLGAGLFHIRRFFGLAAHMWLGLRRRRLSSKSDETNQKGRSIKNLVQQG